MGAVISVPVLAVQTTVGAAAYVGMTLLLWVRTKNQAALALLRRTK